MNRNNPRPHTKRTPYLIRRFLPYYKPYRGILAMDLICASLTTVCELVLPLIVRSITDSAMRDIASLTAQAIFRLGGVYVVLRLMDTAAYYYMASFGHIMGSRIETDLRRDLFSHLQKLSNSFYDNAKTGQLMSRITTDLNDVTEFAHHCPEEFFIAALKLVGVFAILCTMNVTLTLIIFIALPPMLLAQSFFNKNMRRAFRSARHELGELNAQVEDSLLGIRVVKAFANEDLERAKFEAGNRRFLSIKREMYLWMAAFHSSTRFFDGIMYILVVVVGALFMIRGAIMPADLVAYLLYVTALLTSISRIVEFTEQFQRGMTGIERFVEVMDEPISIADEPGAKPHVIKRGEVRFEHVSFAYEKGGEEVLSDISLSVEPGESIALVGPSGGGKTTLCNLIPRFYEPTSGRILIDGVDIRDFTLDSLRAQIGIVQQDVYLFSGSVRDNIEYGKPGASMEEIVEAAKMAGADEFIRQLPDGYDTFLGERGVRLSGGQKQRVSIARVFLKNPPILILDEATSALDNESEQVVQRSLETLMRGRTTFTIAHRLTTIRGAKLILVLTDRGIEERGTHEELMAKGGLYSTLYSAMRWSKDVRNRKINRSATLCI
jgi:ATP-binding cassette subfamily B protein